jgi:hypothetical protein
LKFIIQVCYFSSRYEPQPDRLIILLKVKWMWNLLKRYPVNRYELMENLWKQLGIIRYKDLTNEQTY